MSTTNPNFLESLFSNISSAPELMYTYVVSFDTTEQLLATIHEFETYFRTTLVYTPESDTTAAGYHWEELPTPTTEDDDNWWYTYYFTEINLGTLNWLKYNEKNGCYLPVASIECWQNDHGRHCMAVMCGNLFPHHFAQNGISRAILHRGKIESITPYGE